MKAPQNAPRLSQVWALPVRAERPLAMLLAIAMAAFAPMNFAAQASETVGDAQVSASADDSATQSADYRLAPGDRLTIVVYDQPQLSGQFIVDGGGGILLPLAGGVSLSGLTLAEAQQLIQDRFADGVLVQPAVSVRITDYRPIFVTGNVRKPGSYRFMIGQSVKAAIAAAGGEGEPWSRISTAPSRTTSPPSSGYVSSKRITRSCSFARRASKHSAMDARILSCRCLSA